MTHNNKNKMNITEKKAENAKNKDIQPAAAFTKTQRAPFSTDDMLQEGDVILFSELKGKPLEVNTQYFGTPDAEGNRASGEFIVVNVRAKDGSIRAINFFPSSFDKQIFEAAEKDGKVELTGNVIPAKGTAVDFYKSFQGKEENGKTDVQLGVEALINRGDVIVAAKTPMKTQKWRNGVAQNALKDTSLFTYNCAA